VNTAIHEPSAFPPDSITSLHEDSVFGVKGEPQSEIAKLRGGWAKHYKVGSVLSLGRLSSQDPRIYYDCLVLWLGRREQLLKVSLLLVSPSIYNEKTMFPDLDNIVVILDLPEATTPFAGKKMEVGAFAKVCAVVISWYLFVSYWLYCLQLLEADEKRSTDDFARAFGNLKQDILFFF
jgi:hypothetical protein